MDNDQNTATTTPLNNHEPAPPPPSGGMGRNIAVLVVVAIVVAAMIYAGKRNVQVSTGSTAPNGQVEGKIPAGNAVGKPAPDFTLTTLDGKTVKLSDYRGKAVMVNFWATWCGPCKIEMPWFVDLHQQYAPQGFEILGVVSQDDSGKESIEKFTKDMGVNYPILLGNERTDAVSDAYGGLNGLPQTFFVDRGGTIVAQSLGLVGKGEIEDNIKKAMASGGTSSGTSGSGQAQ